MWAFLKTYCRELKPLPFWGFSAFFQAILLGTVGFNAWQIGFRIWLGSVIHTNTMTIQGWQEMSWMGVSVVSFIWTLFLGYLLFWHIARHWKKWKSFIQIVSAKSKCMDK